MEAKFYIENFFTEKTFCTKKNINEHVKNIGISFDIWEIYFHAENICVTNKIKIFLKYKIIKNIFVKTML